jgi:hypothetical protein
VVTVATDAGNALRVVSGVPGGRGRDGKPTEDALPDFVLQISPEDGSEQYRTLEVTFDPPE